MNSRSCIVLRRKRYLTYSSSFKASRICTEERINKRVDKIWKVIKKMNSFTGLLTATWNKVHDWKNPCCTLVDSVRKHWVQKGYGNKDLKELASEILGEDILTNNATNYMFQQLPDSEMSLKNKIPIWTISICIYQFSCSSWACCINCTKFALSTHIYKHYSAWL